MYWLYSEIKSYFNLLKARPLYVGLGAALGAFLGFVPAKCGLVWLIVLIVGLIDFSAITAAAVVGLILKTLSVLVLDPQAWELGRKVNESQWATEHAGLFAMPVVALMGFERYHVMGGTIFGLVAAVPFFIIGYRVQQVILKAREKAADALAARKRKKLEADAQEKAQKEGQDPAAAAAAAIAQFDLDLAKSREPYKRGPIGKVMRWVPKKWAILAVILVCFDLFYAKPLTVTLLKEVLPTQLAGAMGVVDANGKPMKIDNGVTWNENDFDVSLLRGRIRLGDLKVANPKNPKEDLLTAKAAELKCDFSQLLRRRLVVELLALDSPKMNVARDQDGTFSIEPVPPPTEPKEPTDWAGRARKVMDRAKKEYEERKKKEEEEKKKQQEGKSEEVEQAKKRPTTLAEAQQRAKTGIPGQNDALASPPRWVVKQVKLDGFQVACSDPKGSVPSFQFQNALVLDTANDQRAYGQKQVCDLAGSMLAQGGKKQGDVAFHFDADPPAKDKPQGDASAWNMDVKLAEVDLHDIDALIENAVPLRFEKGTATITLVAKGVGVDGTLDATPKISLKGIDARARDPNGTIAGYPATKVAEEVTNCGEFELNDVKITGTVLAPKIDLGQTLTEIVKQGGMNFAKKKGTEMLNKGVDKATEELNKKVPGAGEKIDDAKKNAGDLLKKGFGGLGGFGGGDEKK